MTFSPRSRRAWKLLALLLALPVLGAIVVAAWINTVADRRWAAAQDRIRALSAAFPPPAPRTADATSSETAKDIQANFVSAIRLAVQRQYLAEDVRQFKLLGVSGTEADGVLEEVSDILDRVHVGARRCVASPSEFPPSWRGEWDDRTMGLVMDCILLRSRRRLEMGKPEEGVESLLDGLPLLRFWGESEAPSNRPQALRRLVVLTDELRTLLSRGNLTTHALHQIDVELARSEAWLQLPFRRLEPQLARWAETLPGLQVEAEEFLEGAAYRWRFLLPVRLMKAEAFEFMDRYTRDLLSCEGKPYAEFLRSDQGFWKEQEHSLNPIIHPTRFFLWEDPGWEARQRRAEVLLLRSAARYRGTGELPQLEDPFGDRLHHSESQDRMTFWSAGPDGNDDGGNFDPAQPWHQVWYGHGSKDLAIDVPRFAK